MTPWRPQVLVVILILGIIGTLLLAAEISSDHELEKEGWAALGSVLTALGMLGSRLIDKDD